MPLREATVVTGAGRYHRVGIRSQSGEPDVRLTAEGCNLDDADQVEETTLPPDVAAEALCKRCFRPPELVEA